MRGGHAVPGGFDSYTLPFPQVRELPDDDGCFRRFFRGSEALRFRAWLEPDTQFEPIHAGCRVRRYDDAKRAYEQAKSVIGSTPRIEAGLRRVEDALKR